jgi:hypothetical protein
MLLLLLLLPARSIHLSHSWPAHHPKVVLPPLFSMCRLTACVAEGTCINGMCC